MYKETNYSAPEYDWMRSPVTEEELNHLLKAAMRTGPSLGSRSSPTGQHVVVPIISLALNELILRRKIDAALEPPSPIPAAQEEQS